MGRRVPTNYFPTDSYAASQLLTDFMRVRDVIWDNDQSDFAIVQAAHHEERTLGLSFDEAQSLVVHKILSKEGPASIIPEAACYADNAVTARSRCPSAKSKIDALAI